MQQTKTKQPGKPTSPALTLHDVGRMDELKQLGFRMEKLSSGFSAYEISGERVFKADRMDALITKVKLALANGDGNGKSGAAPSPAREPEEDLQFEKVKENAKGQPYLDGAEPLVPRTLNVMVEDHHDAKREFADATRRLNEAKKKMEEEADLAKYDKLFKTHPNKKNTLYFDTGKILLLRKDENQRSYQTVDRDDEDLTPKV